MVRSLVITQNGRTDATDRPLGLRGNKGHELPKMNPSIIFFNQCFFFQNIFTLLSTWKLLTQQSGPALGNIHEVGKWITARQLEHDSLPLDVFRALSSG